MRCTAFTFSDTHARFSQQSGHHLIGQLLKRVMYLLFQMGELARVFAQLLQPLLLAALNLARNLGHELGQRRHDGTTLGLGTHFHARDLRAWNSFPQRRPLIYRRHVSRSTTFWEGTRND